MYLNYNHLINEHEYIYNHNDIVNSFSFRESTYKTMRTLQLLILFLYFDIFAYDRSEHPVKFGTLPKIVSIQVDGDVHVFPKSGVLKNTSDDTLLVFSNVLKIVFSTFTFGPSTVSSHLKLQRGLRINPQDTDSIQVHGKTGYPSPDKKNWIFNQYDKGISIFSVHPSKFKIKYWPNSDVTTPPFEFSHVLYRFNDGEFTKVPSQLVVSNNRTLKRPKTDICSLGDSLARIPRLFSEYKYDQIAVLELYGTIQNPQKYSLEKEQKVAKLTRDIYETSLTLPRRKASELMKLDSGNVVLHVKLADNYRRKEDFLKARQEIDHAKQNSVFEDYYVSYAEARIFEKQNDVINSLQAYKKAYTHTAQFTSGKALIIREKALKKIEKLSKKI